MNNVDTFSSSFGLAPFRTSPVETERGEFIFFQSCSFPEDGHNGLIFWGLLPSVSYVGLFYGYKAQLMRR